MGIKSKETSRELTGGFEILSVDGLSCTVRGGWIEKDGVSTGISKCKLMLPDDTVDIFVFVSMATDEILFSTAGWVKNCKRLYKLTTSGGVISKIEDEKASYRFSHHSCFTTHGSWLKNMVINANHDWTDFDISSVIDIPSWAKGIMLEVHATETGAVPPGNNVYVLLRKPGDTLQSQWKLVKPQFSNIPFTRTVPVEFGVDGKTIQYKVDVDTSIEIKVALAGWVPG